MLFIVLALMPRASAQEESLYVGFGIPAQNALKFNRFLINPTFTAVREHQSYLSLYHRNQSVSFDNNNQAYLLGYQGKSSERSGAGISVFSQRQGVISNFGVLVNYAYGVKLGEKSAFTFGGNLAYYKSGYDESSAITGQFDPYLSGLQDGTFLKFQPGFTLSVGAFDFGMVAENLVDYDLKSSTSLTDFSGKIFAGQIQYTSPLKANSGIMEAGQLRVMGRGRNNPGRNMEIGGNLLLDLPKLGWLQGGYDSYFGASAGVGFNLSPQLSMGYVMEKSVSGSLVNLGMTHEISLAYTFSPQKYEDRKMLEADYEADETEEMAQVPSPTEAEIQVEQLGELKEKLAQNDAILGQLTKRPDSLEAARNEALQKRFEMAVTEVRQKTGVDSFALKTEKEIKTDLKHEAIAVENAHVAETDSTSRITSLAEAVTEPQEAQRTADISVVPAIKKSESETKTAKDSAAPVLRRRFNNLPDVTPGFYIIANVYRGDEYRQKFMDKMASIGHQPDYITNPQNNLKYVYLNRFESLKEAEKAVQSQIGGSYLGTLWIMDVRTGRPSDKAITSTNVKPNERENYNDEVLRKNVVIRDRLNTDNQDQELFGTGSKYYIIANVFKSSKNAARFIKYLNSIGLSANYFINPKNKYRYVYLKRFETWNGALISYYSKLNEAYQAEMWIMRVTPDLIT